MYAVYVLELVVTLGEGQTFFSVSFAPFISYRWGASVGVKWLWPSCELVIIINLPLIGGGGGTRKLKSVMWTWFNTFLSFLNFFVIDFAAVLILAEHFHSVLVLIFEFLFVLL